MHWRVRWAAQREAKEWGLFAGMEAVHAVCGSPCVYPLWTHCEATVRFRWPDRRRRDLDNALSACKPYLDSFTELGIWVDDSCVSFVIPAAVIDRERPGVTISIYPVQGDE
ncbi:MAG: RusA family crossover junction endodeoxyribonuclease [Thermomicrobia bacterium]|nr:RusA family crossover junction endodeoxyribonuclease [Thermomicrobia bacterium]MCA1723332.1 RusA family crossover junction endodeoxyribonuclease [Thermomicrobia bacterium]